MTADIYGHLVDGADKAAAMAFEVAMKSIAENHPPSFPPVAKMIIVVMVL